MAGSRRQGPAPTLRELDLRPHQDGGRTQCREAKMQARFRPLLLSIAALLVAGCAVLPDGSRIQRLPESAAAGSPAAAPAASASPVPPAAPAAPLSAEESRALTELNARILREQDEARRREEALAMQREREAQLYWGLGYGYGWPYGWHRGRHGGWVWLGSSWHWRPYWGVELWTPLPR
jgi:hypothetical protein